MERVYKRFLATGILLIVFVVLADLIKKFNIPAIDGEDSFMSNDIYSGLVVTACIIGSMLILFSYFGLRRLRGRDKSLQSIWQSERGEKPSEVVLGILGGLSVIIASFVLLFVLAGVVIPSVNSFMVSSYNTYSISKNSARDHGESVLEQCSKSDRAVIVTEKIRTRKDANSATGLSYYTDSGSISNWVARKSEDSYVLNGNLDYHKVNLPGGIGLGYGFTVPKGDMKFRNSTLNWSADCSSLQLGDMNSFYTALEGLESIYES